MATSITDAPANASVSLATTLTEVTCTARAKFRVLLYASGEDVFLQLSGGTDGGAKGTTFTVPNGEALDIGLVRKFWVASTAGTGDCEIALLPA